jgi:predicted RNase H-like HicB family nuclease
LTAIIRRERAGYVALCPELDIASQGASVEEATANLAEAVELFFEASGPAEIDERFADEIYVTRLRVGSS